MMDVDLGLAKQFQIHERMRLRLEASFTSVLNHVNYAPPATSISNPSVFGASQSAMPQGSGGNRARQTARFPEIGPSILASRRLRARLPFEPAED